jgi:hypothetical protein
MYSKYRTIDETLGKSSGLREASPYTSEAGARRRGRRQQVGRSFFQSDVLTGTSCFCIKEGEKVYKLQQEYTSNRNCANTLTTRCLSIRCSVNKFR